MSKMLWELSLPVELAEMKENLSRNNIWKYLRYFNMYMSRFKLKPNEEDAEEFSYSYFSKILFNGKVGIIDDIVYGLTVGRISEEKKDAKGKVIKVDFEYDNGKIRRGLEVNKDVVIAYADKTRIPPILYIVAIANKILAKEGIIDQQDNMLRKPIVITGEGEEFDNAMNNAQNVLSGIEWINTKKGKSKKGSILNTEEMQVLNLQLGNAYKGSELWDSRKHYEELLFDYVGYSTTKNEKRERMNTLEVQQETSVGDTCYKASVDCIEEMIKAVKTVFGKSIQLEKLLEKEEVSENDSNENLERDDNQRKNED